MDIMQQLFGAGLTKSSKIKKSFLGGIGFGAFGAAQDVAMIGFQVSKAGRGGVVPAIVGQSMAIAAGIPIAGFASAALCLVPGIGPFAAAIMGNLLTNYAEIRFGSTLSKKVRLLTEFNKQTRHLEMGGSYQDSELASRQRLIALQDMNSSMTPSRRYLGQEARLMHR